MRIHYQHTLETAAFFMGDTPDVCINNVLEVLDAQPGWHEGADLDMDDECIEDVIASIDALVTT